MLHIVPFLCHCCSQSLQSYATVLSRVNIISYYVHIHISLSVYLHERITLHSTLPLSLLRLITYYTNKSSLRNRIIIFEYMYMKCVKFEFSFFLFQFQDVVIIKKRWMSWMTSQSSGTPTFQISRNRNRNRYTTKAVFYSIQIRFQNREICKHWT